METLEQIANLDGPELRERLMADPLLAAQLEPRIGTALCDVHGCDELSTCIVGCGEGHPSCDRHARGEDYVFPPRPEKEPKTYPNYKAMGITPWNRASRRAAKFGKK